MMLAGSSCSCQRVNRQQAAAAAAAAAPASTASMFRSRLQLIIALSVRSRHSLTQSHALRTPGCLTGGMHHQRSACSMLHNMLSDLQTFERPKDSSRMQQCPLSIT